jgi:hypothetical protein
MKYKKLGGLDWFIIALGIVIIVMIVNAITGCTSQRAERLEVIWIEGADCSFHATGMSVEDVKAMQAKWKLGKCTVTSETDIGSNTKQDLPKE